jgi:pre-rRNA-processing protein TSR4
MEPCDVAEAEAAPADATPADAEAAERRRAANRKKRARQRAKKAAQKEEAGSPSGHSAADESDDEEDKVPPAESLAAVDLSDPSPDAAAPADDGDPLDDIDFSDSDGDEQEAEPEDISLGFAVEGDRDGLLRNQFASKLGGPPAWLDPVQLPLESELRCAVSGLPLRFLLQVYAPLDDHDERAFHRAIYLFISPCGSRLDQPGAVRAFRTQLPRDNELYPFEPPEPGDQPRALTAPQAAVAKARCKPHAPQEAAVPGAHAHYFEHELVVEPEPEASEAVGASDSDHVNKLVDEYRSKEAPEPGKDEGKDEGKPAKPDTDIFGKTEPEVADFASFTARLARAPEQCLRYTFGSDASPLWTSRARRPPAGAVPACPRCGGRRRFEFQVMPQVRDRG